MSSEEKLKRLEQIKKIKEELEADRLRLIVSQTAKELGESVNNHLKNMYDTDLSFILPMDEIFFEDGHLKVVIKDTVRDKNLFILTDIGNCSVTYNMRGYLNHMSPNDISQQLRDIIGACNSHAGNLNIVMPLLYAGRQHRRNDRENLACGQFLRELDNNPNIGSIITFDAHDPGVEHAVQYTEFDNFFATDIMLDRFIKETDAEYLKKLVFIAPDNGATGRRNVYLNSFNCSLVDRIAGSFVKVRDYNLIVDGKNPIISHDYCGVDDLEGRVALVSDDMISSGKSMFDVIDELKKRKVKKIYLFVTFSLFTNGIDKFREYYESGLLDGVYTTNLTFIDKKFKDEKWLHICDCSLQLADIIYRIHNNLSISDLLRDRTVTIKTLRKKLTGSSLE